MSVQCTLGMFEVGDLVQFNFPPQYGIIKWIEFLPDLDVEYMQE